MSTERAMATFEELAEAYKNAPVPTADDVTVLFDGRRLDSKAKVLGWLVEIEADRAAGRSALDELP